MTLCDDKRVRRTEHVCKQTVRLCVSAAGAMLDPHWIVDTCGLGLLDARNETVNNGAGYAFPAFPLM